jgi:hypothetical protein
MGVGKAKPRAGEGGGPRHLDPAPSASSPRHFPLQRFCPPLPCSKTQPRSSGLRGRAAPPAGRTAPRPAPAPSRPWRRRPAPGKALHSNALTQDGSSPTAARPVPAARTWQSRGKKQESLLSAGEEGELVFPDPTRSDTASSPQPRLAARGATPLSVLRPAHQPHCAGAGGRPE